MKPFYRVLTYLVLIIQSFIILALLADRRQAACSYARVSSATDIHSKDVPGKQYAGWDCSALFGDLLPLRFYYRKD